MWWGLFLWIFLCYIDWKKGILDRSAEGLPEEVRRCTDRYATLFMEVLDGKRKNDDPEFTALCRRLDDWEGDPTLSALVNGYRRDATHMADLGRHERYAQEAKAHLQRVLLDEYKTYGDRLWPKLESYGMAYEYYPGNAAGEPNKADLTFTEDIIKKYKVDHPDLAMWVARLHL